MKNAKDADSPVPSDQHPGLREDLQEVDAHSPTMAGTHPSAQAVTPARTPEPGRAADPSASPETDGAALKPGTAIGRYLLLGRLGEGGMGVVHAAFDTELERKVAIKLLHPSSADDGTQGRARLLREAQVLAQLAHPNIVSIYDVGTYDSQVFIAMEFIDGGTLTQWLAEKPRTVAEVLDMFVQAGRGLSAAHAAKFIHRDFKPDNVLLGTDKRVRVTDFGVARLVSLEAGPATKPDLSAIQLQPWSSGLQTPLTSADALIGTPRYMAPEQFDGRLTDARTDQFSFCVSLYQALYDQPPFVGETLSELYKNALHGRIQPPPSSTRVPTWLHRALQRGMAAEPDRRFASMEELLHVLCPPISISWQVKVLVACAAMLSLILGSAMMAFVISKRDPCAAENAAATRAIEQVWNKSARRRFLTANVPGSAVRSWAGEELQPKLTQYAADWLAAKQNFCKLVGPGNKLAERRHPRARCLDRLLAEFKVVTGFLAQPELNQAAVQSALTAARILNPINSCENLKGYFKPAPDKDFDKVDQLERDLAAARFFEAGAEFQRVLENSQELVERAKVLGYKPAYAESLLLLAGMQQLASDRRTAAATFDKAALVGLEGRHLRVAADALVSLAPLAAFDQKSELSQSYIKLAEAMLKATDSDPLGWASVAYARGMLAIASGDFKEALKQHGEALALRQKNSAPLTDIATSHTGLALVWRRMHMENEASASQKEALDIYQKAFGAAHPKVAMAMGLLGSIQTTKGNYGPALNNLTTAIQINKHAMGEEHVSNANLFRMLAILQEAQGEYGSAIDSLKHGISIQKKQAKDAQQDMEPNLRELSQVYLARGEYGRAEEKAQEAIQIAAPYKSSPARILLGRALACRGQLSEARSSVQQALEASQRRLGAQHSEVAEAQFWLGVILGQQGKAKEALAMHQQALATREKAADPFDLGRSLIAVANAATELRQPREALALLKAKAQIKPHQHHQRQRFDAEVQIALAGALWEVGQRKDDSSVVPLLQGAHKIYEQPGMVDLCEQQRLARWLKKRGLGPVWELIVSPAVGTSP